MKHASILATLLLLAISSFAQNNRIDRAAPQNYKTGSPYIQEIYHHWKQQSKYALMDNSEQDEKLRKKLQYQEPIYKVQSPIFPTPEIKTYHFKNNWSRSGTTSWH